MLLKLFIADIKSLLALEIASTTSAEVTDPPTPTPELAETLFDRALYAEVRLLSKTALEDTVADNPDTILLKAL